MSEKTISEQHIATFQRLLDDTPDYDGEDPRACHYRALRTAYKAAMILLSGKLMERHLQLLAAAEPFIDCLDHIEDDESDEEWAKFRLLVKDYRGLAAAAKEGIDHV